jgi:hypothetical protein
LAHARGSAVEGAVAENCPAGQVRPAPSASPCCSVVGPGGSGVLDTHRFRCDIEPVRSSRMQAQRRRSWALLTGGDDEHHTSAIR